MQRVTARQQILGLLADMVGGVRPFEVVTAQQGPRLGEPVRVVEPLVAETWALLRRDYLERPYSPDHVGKETKDLLTSRNTLHRLVNKAFKDERLRQVALFSVILAGHDPRNVPSWMGMMDYVEQNVGVWSVPGGLGALAELLTKRLAERKADVRVGTTVRDIALTNGKPTGVDTDQGVIGADLVVCAIDPRGVPALAKMVHRTMPAIPPVVCHLGLRGDVPDLPDELVLHGDPMLVVRTSGTAPE